MGAKLWPVTGPHPGVSGNHSTHWSHPWPFWFLGSDCFRTEKEFCANNTDFFKKLL